MLDRVEAYVNYYFPQNKTEFYDDNFIKACLVYKFLCFNLLSKNLDINHIIYRLSDYRHCCNASSPALCNHLIFSLAFREFWKHYKKGRGCVYVINLPNSARLEVIGLLTGIIYWFFHKEVI